MLLIFSVINAHKSAVQALIVVPTRELGMQVRLDSVSSKLCLNFMYFLLSFVLIFHSVVLKFVLLPCFDKNSFGRVTKMSVCVCVFFFGGAI